MKNLLIEAQDLIATPEIPTKIGVIKSVRDDAGYNIETSTGSTDVVYGSANIGDTVSYEKDRIISVLATETTTLFVIK